MKAMGALEMGVEEAELKPLVDAWRTANPNIVRLWWDVDKVAMRAVRDRTRNRKTVWSGSMSIGDQKSPVP